MVQKKLKKSQWLWQDYVGARWNNLEWANTGDDKASYVYPQGKNSKSAYRPKSLFYHYQMDGIDGNKYKLDSVKWVLVIGKYNVQKNNLPTIKVFVGDNNAPYKKDPIKKITAHKLLDNYFDFDHYTMQFDLTGVTISQLKNLIIEVDFEKTKTTESSTVSVNRARLVVDYSPKNPKFSIYDSVNTTSANTNEKINWKLTVKNTGYSGSETVTLSLPKNMSVVSSTGGGTYNNSTKTWSTGTLAKNGTVTRTFQLKSTTVGSKTLKATQNSNDVTNKVLTRQVNFTKPPSKPVNTVVANRKDKITYTFYDTFEKESYQYFDIEIQGYSENHSTSQTCYELSTSNNVDLYLPVKDNAELIEENINVNGIITNISGDGTERLLCLSIVPNKDFVANVRVYIYCNDDDVGSVTIRDVDNRTFTETFDILPRRKHFFITDVQTSRDKQYVMNSVNIGSPNSWTIRAKASKKNFFEEKRTNFAISIEDLIAYIGVIPLSRCHKADVNATSKNTLIENRYLNRAYYGKKGDYSEDIKMTLRMHWTDVATLQGLCEMDKPIPIDTIPYFADGDPLNHRGWAEIYEVSNIKKINDMLYECDVGVKYLTHNILTMFGITDGKKITENAIKFYLALTHDYNEDMLDLFRLNYYEFFATIEDKNGDMYGEYDIPSSSNLTFNSTKELNRYSTYDLIYRNQLPSLYSEDYDGNWEMAIRVLNQSDRTVLFEHKYNNFQHYDRNTTQVYNKADVTTTVNNGGNMEVINYDTIGLGFDELAPLLEDRKIATHFNTMESVNVVGIDDTFELFLLDADDKALSNQTVRVKVSNDDNYSDSFNVVTDIYGRLMFSLNLANDTYHIQAMFDETDTYRSCEYNTDITIEYDEVRYHFEYQNTPAVNKLNYEYTGTLLDDNNDGVSGILLHYSFKDLGSTNYGYERTVMTDENGGFAIPIDWDNGSKNIRVRMKGFTYDGSVYEPVFFEEQVNINIDLDSISIESDNVEIIQGDYVKNYYVLVKDDKGNALPNKTITFGFYNSEQTFVNVATTNDMGVASVPIYLFGDSWRVDAHFKGDATYKPCIASHNVDIIKFERKSTHIVSENLILDEDLLLSGDQEYYTVTLLDGNDAPIIDEPISFTVENDLTETTYVETVLITDKDGKVKLPFISHSENVSILSQYLGCVRYAPSDCLDTVVFAEKTGKADVTFSQSDGKIKVTQGNVTQPIDENENISAVIVTKPSNPRQTGGTDIKYYTSLNSGTFNVTVLYKGNDTFYSKMRTLSYTHSTDTRLDSREFNNIPSGQSGYTVDVPFYQDYEKGKFYGYPVWANWDCGLQKGRWYWLPYVENWDTYYSKEQWKSSTLKSSLAVATQGQLLDPNNGYIKYGKWGFDSKAIYTSDYENKVAFFWMDDTDHYVINNVCPLSQRNTGSFTKTDATLEVNGFAENHETYQQITVNATNSNATLNEQINEYYILKLTNLDTLEQLYFYSYLIDSTTVSQIKFLLIQGNWEMEVLGQGTSNYNCTRYITTDTINTDTIEPTPQVTTFTDEYNYTELEDEIEFTTDGFNMFFTGGK